MKKDKQWAISELTKSINFFKAAARNGFSTEYFYGKELGTREAIQILEKLDEPETIEETTLLLENVLKENKRLGKLLEEKHEEWLELMDEINNQEVLSQEWISEKSVDTHVDTVNGEIQVTFILDDLKELLVPKQELPAIPNYVAKWISKHHERFDLYPALKRLENNALSWEDVYEWYRKNTRKFVNAYLTGEYEVEEEQKFIIKVSDSLYLSQPLGDASNNEIVTTWSEKQAYKFKDVESIESHLSKFNGAKAVSVEELEE